MHARGALLPGPGDEAADRFVRQQLFHRGEALRQREGVVRAVDGAVAGAADGDRAVQGRVGVALLSVTLVGAPAFFFRRERFFNQMMSASSSWGGRVVVGALFVYTLLRGTLVHKN